MGFQSKEKKSIIIRVLSVVLPLAALAFVVEKIWSVRLQIFSELDVRKAIFIILGGSILYALDNLFLVLAWRQLVDWFGETKTNFVTSMKIYGRTQIAKYIPGNIFHLPSRHLLGRQLGLDHVPLLGAAIFEIVGLLLVSGIISSLGILIGKSQMMQPIVAFSIIITGVFSPLVFGVIFSHVPILQKIGLPRKNIAEMYKVLMPNWFIYLFFLLTAGMILWIIIYGVEGTWAHIPVGGVLSAYAASWLIGTVTPGAPAGAGVRETVLILMLSGFLGESTSVLIALISRIVTIIGDVCFYLFVQIIR